MALERGPVQLTYGFKIQYQNDDVTTKLSGRGGVDIHSLLIKVVSELGVSPLAVTTQASRAPTTAAKTRAGWHMIFDATLLGDAFQLKKDQKESLQDNAGNTHIPMLPRMNTDELVPFIHNLHDLFGIINLKNRDDNLIHFNPYSSTTARVPVMTIVNFVTIAANFEHVLDSMYADTLFNDERTSHVTRAFEDGARGRRAAQRPHQAMCLLAAAEDQDLTELITKLQPLRQIPANAQGSIPDHHRIALREDLRTVEFRGWIHVADHDELGMWVAFVNALVRFCHVATDGEVLDLVKESMRPTFRIGELMRYCHMPEDVVRYWTRVVTPRPWYKWLHSAWEDPDPLEMESLLGQGGAPANIQGTPAPQQQTPASQQQTPVTQQQPPAPPQQTPVTQVAPTNDLAGKTEEELWAMMRSGPATFTPGTAQPQYGARKIAAEKEIRRRAAGVHVTYTEDLTEKTFEELAALYQPGQGVFWQSSPEYGARKEAVEAELARRAANAKNLTAATSDELIQLRMPRPGELMLGTRAN